MPIQPKPQPPYYTKDTYTNTYLQTHSKTTILTDAQIKTLPATPIEIIPSPGINKAIVAQIARGFGQAILTIDWTADYTNISSNATIDFYLGTNFGYTTYGQTTTLQNFLAWGAADPIWLIANTDNVGTGSPYNSITDWINSGLYIGITNPLGNLTGGNAANTLSITVYYTIINL